MNDKTTVGINLDSLEALARKVAEHSDEIGIEEWHTADGELNLLAPRPDVEFIAACSPVAILQLIYLARRAEPSVAADEREFAEWLNDHRDADVSSVFHEIVAKYRAALASPAVPEGYKLVPIEPTPAQQQAGHDTPGAHGYNASYRAMVKAAPAVSQKATTFDDGSTFELTGWAGGAAPGGAFSTVTCEYRKPDGTVEVINYVRAPAVNFCPKDVGVCGQPSYCSDCPNTPATQQAVSQMDGAARRINIENAQQYMEESLWAFIECAGNYPSIKPDARIWPHVMAYAPHDNTPAATTASASEIPPPKYPNMRVLVHGDVSECCGYTESQMRAAHTNQIAIDIKSLTCAAKPAGYSATEARIFNLGFYAGTAASAEVAQKAARAPLPAQGDELSDNELRQMRRIIAIAGVAGADALDSVTAMACFWSLTGEIIRKLEYAAPAQAGDALDSLVGPVAWLEAEPAARDTPLAGVIQGMWCSSRWHMVKPITSNPVWEIFGRPAGHDSAMSASQDQKREAE